MRTVPVYEAKTRLSELLAAVEHGEQVTITRHGRAIARLVSAVEADASVQSQRQRVVGAFARLRELRKGVSLGQELREAMEEGRD
ncbi:type II toxin-antitoxin system prevent-host-death family antitoxin [Pseudothauera nasutitermitis]|uniref:Antitoxin n=1 Tax=Pseudothauera nasutitermitis TaxID=2565930 RepID=A0A4S4AVK8_9RHOO|nr:type II toxin-antitoxin system prevent-host-death family antitoxin [Pseudothauera nasutitermitis]THF63600.1 type II toxin-antitoxin system prevent-host-death family antitoxin [Pseudothauera nasutitermitis]